MTREEFIEELGALYESVGQPRLEGRLAALLLVTAGPVSLTELSRQLGIAKSAVSKLVNSMLERGDVVREGRFSTREHLYQLTDHSYIRDLRQRAEVSRRVSELSSLLASDQGATEMQVVQRLQTHAGIHGQVAMALDRVLAPEEKLHEMELRLHEQENWDAIPPKERDEGT